MRKYDSKVVEIGGVLYKALIEVLREEVLMDMRWLNIMPFYE